MKPQQIDPVTAAFPADVSNLMPAYNEIPDEFKGYGTSWDSLVSHWFFKGIKGAVFFPKEGIDQKAALRHLGTILRSFQPTHEHKKAAVAYLLSLWFDKVEYNGKIYQ